MKKFWMHWRVTGALAAVLVACGAYWWLLLAQQQEQTTFAETQTELRATHIARTLAAQMETLMGGLEYLARSLAVLHEHDPQHTFQLAASDALVLSSYREGFPNVVLQACAMGIPAVVTDISGCNEIIESGMNGWLAQPRDVTSLTSAMMQAVETPHDRMTEMGTSARARIVERFDRTAHWERMQNFYLQELDID